MQTCWKASFPYEMIEKSIANYLGFPKEQSLLSSALQVQTKRMHVSSVCLYLLHYGAAGFFFIIIIIFAGMTLA